MGSISPILMQQVDPTQFKSNFQFSAVLVVVCLVILIGLWLIDVLPYLLEKDE